MLMEFFWSQCQVLSVCRSSQYLNFIPPQWDLWALNCGYVGLYGSVNASLIFIQANETFWHNSARLELYTGEGGGSQDLMLYHMLSIRMKELLLFYFERERKRGKPYLSFCYVTVTSGSVIVTCQWVLHGTTIADPHGHFTGVIFYLPCVSLIVVPFPASTESLCCFFMELSPLWWLVGALYSLYILLCFPPVVPYVLKSCAEFIETHGIVDGIYRLSGVTSNIQKLRWGQHLGLSEGFEDIVWYLFGVSLSGTDCGQQSSTLMQKISCLQSW